MNDKDRKNKSIVGNSLFIILIFFGIFGLAKSSWAATINAASNSLAHVQEAVAIEAVMSAATK